MKFASRPAFITVKKSVMKLDQDGEPVGSSDDEGRKQPPQMDAPTRVRPFSVGKLRDLVEQAKEQQKSDVRASTESVAAVVTTKPVPVASAKASLLRTPVKGSVLAAAAVLVFAGVGLAIVLMPKGTQLAASAEPPAAVAAAAPAPEPAPAPAAPASAAGFVFTDPVVLLPGATPEGPTAAAKPVEKTADKAPEKTPEKHRPAADKPPAAAPPAVAKAPEPKADPKTPPSAAANNEMDEMRRIQQMANSQLDKSIH